MYHRMADNLILSNGRSLRVSKSRWEGKLDEEQIAFCKAEGVELGFDPVQQGWVILADEYEDDTLHQFAAPQHATILLDADASRFTFRSWHHSDLETYLALLDDPAVWRYLPEAYPGPIDRETARSLIEISNAGTHHDVCAVLRDGEIVGQARLAFLDTIRNRDVAEISYWTGQVHWGKGFGGDIVRLFTARSFEKYTSLREIYASVHRDNIASERALEKAGYRRDFDSSGDNNLNILRTFRSSTSDQRAAVSRGETARVRTH